MLKRLVNLSLSSFMLFLGLGAMIVIGQEAAEQKAISSSPPSTASRLPLKPCRVPGLDEEVLCGKYDVYENRHSRTGRKVSLNIVVLPALSSTPAPDPLFKFAGGPGQAATESASEDAKLFAKIRRNRDIVLVDQRGTGLSNPLDCEFGDVNEVVEAFLAGNFPDEKVRSCRTHLEQSADLRFYTTPIAVEDVDEVRSWLGYGRINLYGGSYGTRAALVYLRRYPDHVRTVALRAVFPLSLRNPLYSPRDAQRSLERLFDDCAADEACTKAFPNLRQDLQTVLSRLEKDSVKIKISDPRTAAGVEVELSRDIFAGGLRRLLYTSNSQRIVPLLIRSALANDFRPFESVISQTLGIEKILSAGMLVSVTCAEDVRLIRRKDIARETNGTFLGATMIESLMRVCKEWPRGELPAAYHRPVRSDTPVLILSGELDPITPPSWGAEVAQHLPNGLHVVMSGIAHGPFPNCGVEIMTEFISKGSAKGLDISCVKELRRPPFTIPSAKSAP